METVAPLISFNWTLLMVLATFAILCIVLRKIFFERIHNMVQAREQSVQDQFDNAEAAERQAEEHIVEYRARLENADIERRDILKDARATAEKRAEEIIKEAEYKAEEMIKQTEKEIEREREKFAETMHEQVAMLAIYAAEKIIEQQLGENEHMELIDDIIKKDGDKIWTH